METEDVYGGEITSAKDNTQEKKATTLKQYGNVSPLSY
jgi:hypothetical protein